MNFLEKIDYLMKRDGLNKNTLSAKSGVPYTTIDAFYKKGYQNVKMGTVRRLATAFGVTLDYLMDDDISDENHGKQTTPQIEKSPAAESSEAIEIAKKVIMLNEKQKDAVKTMIDSYTDNQQK